MSDIKSVLTLLCQHINLSINVSIKPEHFRLAKFNTASENVSDEFWKVLNILSYHAVKEKQMDIGVLRCDVVGATKLYFAYLNYSAIEFYASGQHSKNNRPLLLAFAWILGTQNVLNIITRINLTKSQLGRECSYSLNKLQKKGTKYSIPLSLTAQINHALYLNGKVNYNIKEISELVSEKIKLTAKAHAATINVSGLPHLSVSEAALVKHISATNTLSVQDKKHIKELHAIANLLDIHMKWSKKEHVFFEWMVTVVEEHNKSLDSSLQDIDWNEVSKFVSLLKRVTQERFESLTKTDSGNSQNYKPQCVSRLLRFKGDGTEVENWLTELTTELNKETGNLIERKEKLSKKLQEVLKSIPSCVQV
ncbi:uncharacterized protein LOC108632095 [Ceratina calcarata]|uniref:Uncharacterized protein LOC108632095 n=1 Tax=Ceratina calcarata TaxID=156304 RepID=A0AAJ7WG43_9HYME|nr:uncharacterized protein LOC108632095 [Ceratina calcarata]XP_026675189.1 uncharacterized protein LOC108632095 [Ceratina calcarata]